MFPASSKIWLINISLAALIICFGILSFDVWTEKDEAMAEVRAVKDSGAAPPEKSIITRVMPAELSYEIVAEKDLFSPNRAEYLSPETGEKPPKISEKKIFLYGVVTLGGKKQALINDLESGTEAAGGGAKDKWVRIGDTIGNFRVAEIEKEKIVLTEGASRHEIFLHDEKKPSSRPKAAEPAPAAPTVVVTGAEPAAAAGPPAPKPAAGPAAVKSEPAGEYKIINTPFGPTKRRIE